MRHILLECPRFTAARIQLGMHHAVNDAMQHMPNAKMGYAFYCGKNKIHSLQDLKSRISMANQLPEIYKMGTMNILEIMKGIQLNVLYKL